MTFSNHPLPYASQGRTDIEELVRLRIGISRHENIFRLREMVCGLSSKLSKLAVVTALVPGRMVDYRLRLCCRSAEGARSPQRPSKLMLPGGSNSHP